MTKTKRWYQSKGVVAGYVAAAASVLAIFFNIDVGAEEQGQIVEMISMLVASVAGLTAAYGRITASSVITKD